MSKPWTRLSLCAALLWGACSDGPEGEPPRSPASGTGGVAATGGSNGTTDAGGSADAVADAVMDAAVFGETSSPLPLQCGGRECPGDPPRALSDGSPWPWAACCAEGEACGMSSLGGPCQRLLYDRAQRGLQYPHVGERWLYWYENTLGNGPVILRAPKDGSAEPATIAQVGTSVTMRSDASHVYWVEYQRGTTQAMRMEPGGSAPEPIPLGLTFDFPVVERDEDGEHIVIADNSCLHIVRLRMATLEVTVLRDQAGTPGGGGTWIVTDDEAVYCLGNREYGDEGSIIVAVPKGGGEPRVVTETARTQTDGAELLNKLRGMVRVGSWLYLVTNRRNDTGRLERVATRGGPLEVLDTPPGVEPWAGPGGGLVHDPSHRMLYWTNGRTVRRYSLDTGEAADVIACRGAWAVLEGDRAYLVEDPFYAGAWRMWWVPVSELAAWQDRFVRYPEDETASVSMRGTIRCPARQPASPPPPLPCTADNPCAP